MRGAPHTMYSPSVWADDPSDSDIYNHLHYCLAEVGNLPWSICAELSTPDLTIGGRTWRSRRSRYLGYQAGHAYGYTRRQVRQMISALHVELLAMANRRDLYLKRTAAELGLHTPDDPPD